MDGRQNVDENGGAAELMRDIAEQCVNKTITGMRFEPACEVREGPRLVIRLSDGRDLDIPVRSMPRLIAEAVGTGHATSGAGG